MSALYRLKHLQAAANYLLQGLVKYDQSQPEAWTDDLNIAVELQTRLSEACVTHGDDFTVSSKADAIDDSHQFVL